MTATPGTPATPAGAAAPGPGRAPTGGTPAEELLRRARGLGSDVLEFAEALAPPVAPTPDPAGPTVGATPSGSSAPAPAARPVVGATPTATGAVVGATLAALGPTARPALGRRLWTAIRLRPVRSATLALALAAAVAVPVIRNAHLSRPETHAGADLLGRQTGEGYDRMTAVMDSLDVDRVRALSRVDNAAALQAMKSAYWDAYRVLELTAQTNPAASFAVRERMIYFLLKEGMVDEAAAQLRTLHPEKSEMIQDWRVQGLIAAILNARLQINHEGPAAADLEDALDRARRREMEGQAHIKDTGWTKDMATLIDAAGSGSLRVRRGFTTAAEQQAYDRGLVLACQSMKRAAQRLAAGPTQPSP